MNWFYFLLLQLNDSTQTLAAKNAEVESLNDKLASSQFLEVRKRRKSIVGMINKPNVKKSE